MHRAVVMLNVTSSALACPNWDCRHSWKEAGDDAVDHMGGAALVRHPVCKNGSDSPKMRT